MEQFKRIIIVVAVLVCLGGLLIANQVREISSAPIYDWESTTIKGTTENGVYFVIKPNKSAEAEGEVKKGVKLINIKGLVEQRCDNSDEHRLEEKYGAYNVRVEVYEKNKMLDFKVKSWLDQEFVIPVEDGKTYVCSISSINDFHCVYSSIEKELWEPVGLKRPPEWRADASGCTCQLLEI